MDNTEREYRIDVRELELGYREQIAILRGRLLDKGNTIERLTKEKIELKKKNEQLSKVISRTKVPF